MLKRLFEKWTCKHSWKSHNKQEFTRKGIDQYGHKYNHDYTKEVLICENCGKIKIMQY